MEIQLQELIEKIQNEGIRKSAADAEAARAEAQAEARRIVEAAQKEAAALLAQAEADAAKFEKASRAALEQASRNLLLSLGAELSRVLASVVDREVSGAYGDEVLKAALPEVLKAWASKGGEAPAVLLEPAVLDRLSGFFNQKLAGELKSGVVLKAAAGTGAGFRLSSKDGASFYDFSAEAVAELLCAALNPRLSEAVKAAAKGA